MTSNYKFQGINAPAHKNTPTVPMSVYRELAGELQTHKNQINDLKEENRQLNQENQSLRSEIRNLMQAVKKLENTLNYWEEKPHFQPRQSPIYNREENTAYEFPQLDKEQWLSHQEETNHKITKDDENSEINGWLVAAIIVMIVFTFSGIGFMIARPLLNSDQ